jgi:hypothetical protein
MEVEIACPKCNWEPDDNDYWECNCGHVWNTFNTAGKCPGCSKVWEFTQCPGPGFPGGCGAWSKHLDWYRNLGNQISSELRVSLNSDPIEKLY